MVTNLSNFQRFIVFFKVQKHLKKNSIDGKTSTSSDTVKLLGITLDKNMNFKRQMQNICHKANNKALFCIRKSLNLEQAQVLAGTYKYSIKFYIPSTDLDVLLQNE